MRRLFVALSVIASICSPVLAQQASYAPPPQIQSTNAIQTCGPQSGTLSAAGQSVTLACPGASNYLITITTPSGQSALVGTLTSTDSTTGGSRRLVKTGVGPLGISVENLTGSQGSLEYRTVGGGYGQTITASAYTSGQALVTIIAMYEPTTVFINGAVHTSEEEALRAGKAFTASTGNQSVAVGSYLSLTLTNPAGNNFRYVIPPYGRVLACDNPTNQLGPKFYSVGNVTTNLVSTAATVTRRGGASGTSTATVTYGVATTRPDTNPSTSPAVGNPFFGVYLLSQDRTLEPGASTTLSIIGVTTGLAGTPTCGIVISWYEESTS